MPLDNSFDAWNSRCIGWEYRFAFLPKRCFFTNKRIWLKSGYRGTAMWTGPDLPVFEYRWVSKNQYLIQKLKGNI